MTPNRALATAAVVGVMAAVGYMIATRQWRAVVEAFLLATLVVALIRTPSVRRTLDSFPTPHRVVFAVMVFGMAAGQFAAVPDRTFPFSQWAMYGEPPVRPDTDAVPHFHVVGVAPDGAEFALNLAELYPSLTALRASTLLEVVSDVPAAVVEVLCAAGARHNRLQPTRPVVALRLIRRISRLSDPTAPPAETELGRVEVGR